MLLALLTIACLLLLQGLACGTEAAAACITAPQLTELANRSARAAAAAERIREHPRAVAALVRAFCAITTGWACLIGVESLGPELMLRLRGSLGDAAQSTACTSVLFGVGLLSVALGQLVPARMGSRLAPRWLAVCAWPLGLVARAMGVRVRPGKSAADLDALTPHTSDMLRQLVEEAQHQGVVHPRAAEIAVRALSFGDLTVADVMVPRNRVHALPVDAQPEEIRRVLLEEGHSCMPVYESTLDQVVGVLVAKDVLALAWERELIVLQDLLAPPYFAPEIMRAADLLKELQRRRMHFAVAVDELGGTAGIVTIEDLLEELVGEIYGEHDAETPEPMHRENDGSHIVQGSVQLRDINRELHLDLGEGDTFSTVGGLCVSLAGRIPEAGTRLTYEDGTILEVMEASPRRVRLVRVRQGAGDDFNRIAVQPQLNAAP